MFEERNRNQELRDLNRVLGKYIRGTSEELCVLIRSLVGSDPDPDSSISDAITKVKDLKIFLKDLARVRAKLDEIGV